MAFTPVNVTVNVYDAPPPKLTSGAPRVALIGDWASTAPMSVPAPTVREYPGPR
jgi:hypothetical protein